MLEAGKSFNEVEQRIASSGLSDDERAELWLFGWRAWSTRLQDLHSSSRRDGRFPRLTVRAGSRRAR
jgi:hypothetical protein